MAALVLVTSPIAGAPEGMARLPIFPGGVIPTLFPAGTAFWVGYGFAAEPGAPAGASVGGRGTRFELEVDGRRVETRTEVEREGEVAVRRADIAEFPSGLPAGWHELAGRWYDAGRLVLSNRVSVEFVER
ncbi:MAG TPA: hypothetical protein VNK94_05080 [Gaiellaceae bacterium]|jgi:hypothetical protein|nr:hypothetical protein [Gaiellaceae bacterium]